MSGWEIVGLVGGAFFGLFFLVFLWLLLPLFPTYIRSLTSSAKIGAISIAKHSGEDKDFKAGWSRELWFWKVGKLNKAKYATLVESKKAAASYYAAKKSIQP